MFDSVLCQTNATKLRYHFYDPYCMILTHSWLKFCIYVCRSGVRSGTESQKVGRDSSKSTVSVKIQHIFNIYVTYQFFLVNLY